MFQEIIKFFISAVIGGSVTYFFSKKFFVYKRKIKAKEKLRDAFNILSQGHILCIFLQRFDLPKIEKAGLATQHNVQNSLEALQAKQIAKKIAEELKEINIYNDIQPYIASDTWKLFYAYMTIIINAGIFLSAIPYNLDFIKKDKVEEGIIKKVIPVIPKWKIS